MITTEIRTSATKLWWLFGSSSSSLGHNALQGLSGLTSFYQAGKSSQLQKAYKVEKQRDAA